MRLLVRKETTMDSPRFLINQYRSAIIKNAINIKVKPLDHFRKIETTKVPEKYPRKTFNMAQLIPLKTFQKIKGPDFILETPAINGIIALIGPKKRPQKILTFPYFLKNSSPWSRILWLTIFLFFIQLLPQRPSE